MQTFGDDAQGTFRTDEQFCRVETRRRLVGATPSFNHLSGWEDDSLCTEPGHIMLVNVNRDREKRRHTAFRNHSAFAVPYLTAFADVQCQHSRLPGTNATHSQNSQYLAYRRLLHRVLGRAESR